MILTDFEKLPIMKVACNAAEDVASKVHDEALRVLERDKNSSSIIPTEKAWRIQWDKKFLTVVGRFIDEMVEWRRKAQLSEIAENTENY
jgi:hypothetical protein